MPEQSWEKLAGEAGYRPCELAKICKVSLRTLQRHFRSQYGMTLGDWLRKLRLKTAYSRVTAGEPVKEIAYDLSFKQLSHFSRVFKQAYGVPPSTFSLRSRTRFDKLGPVPPPDWRESARPWFS